jgi:hypothetical protein
MFFSLKRDWLYMRPRNTFSTDKRFAIHFLSLLHQTRACNASQRRDLTWELKGGITFYSLVYFSFLESLSKMRKSQIRVKNTLSIFNFSKLATET